MVALNASGEVADLLSVDQFQPSRSAYECVAYAASLCFYAGQPGHGPTGTVLQASNLAQYWYGREEGNDLASNTNGMSLPAMFNMLQGMRMSSHVSPTSLEYVKAWLAVGHPLILCGAETGMYDIGLGDIVPYGWPPSGNHAIVASGIAPDGNLLVHDTANIGPTGVRTGPRIYDAKKLQLVSATAIAVPWLPALPGDYDPTKEVEVTITIDTPGVAEFYVAVPGGWQCKQTGKVIQGEILATYCRWGNAGQCGLSCWGLPKSNEQEIQPGIVRQYFERATVVFDPQKKIDNPPGVGSVYQLDLYSPYGEDPLVPVLEAKLKAQQPIVPTALLTDMQQVKAISSKY
jgi:hypothetical protein